MADFDSTFRYDSDFTKVTNDIKALVREATHANSVFAQLNKTAASVKMEAARSFAAQAGFAGFKTQIVDLTGATEKFGEQLMKNKLTMKEYFREAAQAYKKDSKARILAEREVRRAQSGVVNIGDINGRRRGMLVTPQALDMKNASVQLKIASKQYEIFNDLVQKGSTALVNWGKNTQWAGRQLTVGLTVPMGIFASQALKAFADVDKEITRFRKVYGSDLTGTVGDATDQMVEQIRGMGAEFAKQYGIASKETIALAADLAAAGLEGERLANSLNQTTRMMVLGEVDRQEAMKATLSIQTAFNQSSKDLAQSVDFLNAVENQTSASLQDLVEAIPKTGPVIQALGGDIKDLSVLMTALREGGINAAEGANALKSGMASLISPTTKATALAKQFGIDLEGIVQKNKGELMPMLLDFQDALSGLDSFGKAKLIEEIFGKYQFARISALFDNLNQQGSQTVGMVKLLKASSDELAKKSYSELKAQENAPSTRLAAMQQTLQENLIKVGADLAETLLPIMQGALDILQKIVEGFNNLPEPIKNFVKIIGGITAAAGPILMLAGIFGNLIGNAIKFGMSIVNMFKKLTGHPVQTLQILSDEELAAKLAADQLTNAYHRQKTSVMELNAALNTYIANLRNAAQIAPPGAVAPGGTGPFPRRFKTGGIVYAKNGVDSGGRINGYGGGDTVPAMLEQGEFVINKKSSRKYAPLLKAINQGKDIPGFTNGKTDGYGPAKETKRSAIYDGVGGTAKKIESIFSGITDKGLRDDLERMLGISSTSSEIHSMAYDEGKMYHNKWALSHSEKTVTPLLGQLDGQLSYVFKKIFTGKTFVEPYLYNSYMNNTVSQMISGNPQLAGIVGQRFPDVARMISEERVPVSKSEVSKMLAFLHDPEIASALASDKKFNVAARKNTLDYLQSLNALSDLEFAKFKKMQHLAATLSSMSDKDLAAQYSFTDPSTGKLVKMSRGQIFETMMSDTPHQNPRIAAIQKSYGRTFSLLADPNASADRINRRLSIATTAMVGGADLPVLNAKSAKAMATQLESEGFSFVGSGQLKTKNIGIFDKTNTAVRGMIAKALGKRFAKGGPVGGIFEKMVLGVKAKSLKQEELDAVNAHMTTAAAGRTLFSGGISDTAWLGSLKPGDRVRIPGATSLSDDISTAQYFTKKHMPGGAYNNIQRQYTKDELRAMGLNENLIGWKTATTQEESMEMLRGLRIDELLKLRDARERMKALKQKKISIQSSPYPSQVGTMFPQEPLPHEVIARNKELAQIDREILRAQSSDWSAKQNLERYRTHAKVYGRSTPTTAAFVTREGTPYLPITGNVTPGSLQAGVSLAEQESIISEMDAEFVGYREHNGVSIPTFEVVSAASALSPSEKKPWGLKNGGEVSPMRMQKFAFGGRVGKWNTPIGQGERGYEEAVAWRSDKMSDFRKLKVQDVLTDPVSGRHRKVKYSKLATNPLFNKDKLYNLLSTLGNVPSGIPLMRATTLNPGVSTEFSSEQQLRIMNALRTENYDDIFGMPLNQKGLASYTSMDPRTGAYGVHGLGIFFRRNSPAVYGDNPRTGRSRFEEVRTGTGRIEKYHSGYAVNDGRMYVGPHGMEQVLFSHTTSGAERGRVISHPDSNLDELLTYRTDAVVDAISSEWSPGTKYGRTIIHTRGIDPTIQGPVRLATGGKLPGFGGGDKIPAMLEPGEFVINKDSAKKYGAVLDKINKDGLPGYAVGGLITSGLRMAERSYDMTGGIAGMAGNLAFLPMTIEQVKTAGNDLAGVMTKFTAATQVATAAISLLGMASKVTAAGGALSKGLSAANVAAGRGGDAARRATSGAAAARAAGGGKIVQGVTSLLARVPAPMLASLASIAPMLGPIAIGIGVVAAGFVLWNKHVDDLAKTSRSYYKEATEMAKVYNIELNKTKNALAENRKYSEASGIVKKDTRARGQVDVDYAKAVKKTYEDAINGIKELNSEQDKANRLASIYSSLIIQGFSLQQAKETTAEIARQAQATSVFNSLYPRLQSTIKDTDTAMQVFDTTFAYHMSQLGTAKERVDALAEAYSRLQAASNVSPSQSVISIQNLLDTTARNQGAGAIGDLVKSQLANAGIDKAGTDSILQNIMGTTDIQWGTDVGQELATTILTGLNAGMTQEDFMNAMNIDDIKEKVAAAAAIQEGILARNKELQSTVIELQGAIDKTNKQYDDQIAAIEKEKKVIIEAHDKKMKMLEEESEALQDRADLIRDNTDFYIKQLEKEYAAEQYYQKQRDTSLGGLEALSKGDIFGYLQAQTQAASDAEQFGREQAIAQIQDTRDAALKSLEEQMKANDDAKGILDEATNKQLEGKDNQIEALNIARSKIIKELNARIKEAQALMASPELATEKIDEFQKKLKGTIDKLPTTLQEPFKTTGNALAKTVSDTINIKGGELAKTIGASAKAVENQLKLALGTKTTTYDPKTGKVGVELTLPGGYKIQLKSADPKDAGDEFGKKQPPLGSNKVAVYDANSTKYTVYDWKPEKKKYVKSGKPAVYFEDLEKGTKKVELKDLQQYLNKGGKVLKLAKGNIVPGTGNKDTVSAMLTPGEFVINKNATSKNLALLKAINNGARIGYNMGGKAPEYNMPSNRSEYGRNISEIENKVVTISMPTTVNINGGNTNAETAQAVFDVMKRVQKSLSNSIGGS